MYVPNVSLEEGCRPATKAKGETLSLRLEESRLLSCKIKVIEGTIKQGE